MEFKEYQKYRWFYLSSGKLVAGGKNAEQNEYLIRKLKESKKDRIMMHTTEPGSPFSVIFADPKVLKESDIKECAIFTASFSQAWKTGKKRASVDIFNLSQLQKLKTMKIGTWGVKGEIKRVSVPIELVLTKQHDKLRAVPPMTVRSKKDILLKIVPGKADKHLMLPKLQIVLAESFSKDDLLSALPAGGIKIKNDI
mgnify:FL=1